MVTRSAENVENQEKPASLHACERIVEFCQRCSERYEGLSAWDVYMLSATRDKEYSTFTIAKKGGGLRLIRAPSSALKALQRSILDVLSKRFSPHTAATAYISGRSGIVANAQRHTGRRLVYATDLKDFFPTITWPRVYGLLQAPPFGFSSEVARVIANVCTLEGAIPQGAPTSPLISNAICWTLDRRLSGWANKMGYAYTRYADDITLSTDVPYFSKRHEADVHSIIASEGFTVNESKTRTMPHNGRQVVTGLVVNNAEPRLPREYLRGLRALLHNVERHKWKSQVGRSLAFDTYADYEAFRYGADEGEDARRRVQKLQRKRHLLLNPAVRVLSWTSASTRPMSDAVRLFKAVVAGRIDFVGQVHGKDSDEYKRLKDKFDRLCGGQLALQMPKGAAQDRSIARGRSIRRTEHAQITLLGYESVEAYEELRERYRAVRELTAEYEASYLKGESRAHRAGTALALAAHFLKLSNRSPDLASLVHRPMNMSPGQYAKAARQVAFVDSVDPFVTARFAALFNEKEAFKALMHNESVGVSTPEALILSKEIIATYRDHVPNNILNVASQIVDTFERALSTGAGHPWRNGSVRSKLKALKKKIRFDFGPTSSDQSTNLVLWLEKVLQNLKKAYAEDGLTVDVSVPGVDSSAGPPQRLYTYVPAITGGLHHILNSMADNTIEKCKHARAQEGERSEVRPRLDVRFVQEEDVARRCLVVRVIITDGTPDFGTSPVIRNIAQGELQSALSALRGYAEWKLIARFANGKSHHVDLLRGEVGEWGGTVNSVTHTVTLYNLA